MENINQLLIQLLQNRQVFTFLLIWTMFWKGLALWRSSQKRQLVWFIILMLINTLGLLEIIYVFYLNRWDIDKGRLLDFLEKKLKR